MVKLDYVPSYDDRVAKDETGYVFVLAEADGYNVGHVYLELIVRPHEELPYIIREYSRDNDKFEPVMTCRTWGLVQDFFDSVVSQPEEIYVTFDAMGTLMQLSKAIGTR